MPAVRLSTTSTSGRAHPLDHLAVERDVADALAGLRVAHVDVDDGRAGARGLERGVGDLRGRDRDAVAALPVVSPRRP